MCTASVSEPDLCSGSGSLTLAVQTAVRPDQRSPYRAATVGDSPRPAIRSSSVPAK